jgi:pimeloyl-ACP methyl ester carboxylesterase
VTHFGPVTAVRFESGDVVLSGDTWTPAGDVAAGVVMIGGSGPADRTNDGYFDAYRSSLAGHGVAGLSYDKRGVGESTGDYLAGTLDDLATDALAAVGHLAQRLGPRVPVGLFGHSEGGWVAIRAAARSDDVAFVVTNSCPGMSPGEQDRHAIVAAMRADRVPEPDRLSALHLYDGLLRAAAANSAFADVEAAVRKSPGRGALEHYLGPLDATVWPLWSDKSAHDPLHDHRALTCPHLAVYGTADAMVPVQESIEAYTRSACLPGRHVGATLTVHVVPGADHRILRPGRPTPDADHLAALTSWVAAAARRRGSRPQE